MADIPESVKIGPFIYKIILNKEKVQKHALDIHQELYGYIDKDKLEIILDSRIEHQRMQETLLHEVLHGIIDPVARSINVQAEEEIVTLCSPMLLDVLRSNKKFLKYLLDGEDAPQSNKKSNPD